MDKLNISNNNLDERHKKKNIEKILYETNSMKIHENLKLDTIFSKTYYTRYFVSYYKHFEKNYFVDLSYLILSSPRCVKDC